MIADQVAQQCISAYISLPKSFHPSPRSNGLPQYCILAGFVLCETVGVTRQDESAMLPHRLKCISLATGSKCLPYDKLPLDGDVLHDCHAEVLARRGAMRWIYEEMNKVMSNTFHGNNAASTCIQRFIEPDGTSSFRFKDTFSFYMYVSTIPCEYPSFTSSSLTYLMKPLRGGDASTLMLSMMQDPDIAELKNKIDREHSATDLSRGRDNYSAKGVLRTKPGRADSVPTISMSCSDKIALWSMVGFQGATLMSPGLLHEPIYLKGIVIGEVDPLLRPQILGECQRAFGGRFSSAPGQSWVCVTKLDIFYMLTYDFEDCIQPPFAHTMPEVLFTSAPFPFSRSLTKASTRGQEAVASSEGEYQ